MSSSEYSDYSDDSADPSYGYLFIAHLQADEYLIEWCHYIEPIHARYATGNHTFVYFSCDYPRERCIALWESLEHAGYQRDNVSRSHWTISSLFSYYCAVDMLRFHSDC